MKIRTAAIATAALAAVLFVGNFHLFTGSGLLPRVVHRVSFGCSEFIVNSNALMDMPPAMRAMHFPLSSMALQRYWNREIEQAGEIVNRP
jgi:hypothetical protein